MKRVSIADEKEERTSQTSTTAAEPLQMTATASSGLSFLVIVVDDVANIADATAAAFLT